MGEWTDHIVGERMIVDQEFSDRVQQSEFSSQEWGLIMTATEFEIENPDSEDARLVANTDKLPQIMPEVEKVRARQGTMGGHPGEGGSRDRTRGLQNALKSVKNTIGLGDDGVDQERLSAARSLTQEYATELQRHLESTGKWDDVREIVQEQQAQADENDA